jgi:3'-phosphoadenosine 5'-phosphosulfate sulfotransferase (PAPS reductase)/FAD synthetase
MEVQSERYLMDELEAGEAAVELDDQEPQAVLGWAIEKFGRNLGICSSFQAEGCALIDMAWRIDPGIRVFTIDTGRQPEETYQLIERIRDRYGIRVEMFMPDTKVVEPLSQERQHAVALLPGEEGFAAQAGPGEFRCMGNRPSPRSVGHQIEHSQDRDRS